MSQEFASAVYDNTMRLGQGTPRIDFQLDNAPYSLSDFLEGKDVLILPYDYLSGSRTDETGGHPKIYAKRKTGDFL